MFLSWVVILGDFEGKGKGEKKTSNWQRESRAKKTGGSWKITRLNLTKVITIREKGEPCLVTR